MIISNNNMTTKTYSYSCNGIKNPKKVKYGKYFNLPFIFIALSLHGVNIFRRLNGKSISSSIIQELLFVIIYLISGLLLYFIVNLLLKLYNSITKNAIITLDVFTSDISLYFIITLPFIIEYFTGSFEYALIIGLIGIYFEIISVIIIHSADKRKKYISRLTQDRILEIKILLPSLFLYQILTYKIFQFNNEHYFILGKVVKEKYGSLSTDIRMKSITLDNINNIGEQHFNHKYYFYGLNIVNNKYITDTKGYAVLFDLDLNTNSVQNRITEIENEIGKIKIIKVQHELVEIGNGIIPIRLP